MNYDSISVGSNFSTVLNLETFVFQSKILREIIAQVTFNRYHIHVSQLYDSFDK